VAVARQPRRKAPKRERIATHVEELKRLILARYPRARFEMAPVPEARWPGLWVYADFDSALDVFDLVGDAQAEFIGEELSGVYVIPMELNGSND